jgi:uncharacterized delta-60 repeat protein
MKRVYLLLFPVVTLIVSLNLLSCGGGEEETSPVNSSFGSGGKVTTPIGTFDDQAHALAIQTSDGKLVAAGKSSSNGSTGPYEFALVRYNINVTGEKDGSLDTTFNPSGITPGIVTTSIGGADDEAFALAIQSDGKLVAAGKSYNSGIGAFEFALVRYNSDGSLDTGFGSNGIVTTPIANLDDEAFALAIQPDGKLVAAGYSLQGTLYKFALVRYNADGSLDTGFGATGVQTTIIGGIDDRVFALAIQSLDGKLVAAGRSKINTTNGNIYEFVLVRYNTDGSLDTTTFNPTGGANAGIVTTIIGNGGDDEALALIIQSDGKLVAGGYSNNGVQNEFAMVRYNTNGSLDATGFGKQGIVTTPIVTATTPIGIYSVAYALAIQSDGKLVQAGYSTVNNASQQRVFAVARYNTTGSLDKAFNTTGKSTIAIGTSDDEAFAIAVQPQYFNGNPSDPNPRAGILTAAGYTTNKKTGAKEFGLVSYLR